MMMWRALKPETAAAVLRHYFDKRDHAVPNPVRPGVKAPAQPAEPAKIIPEAGE